MKKIKKEKPKLGLFTLTSLVMGNMIGSGIFLLPSNLARVGSISIFSWIFTSIGSFLLALVFSRISTMVPKPGGPYVYAEAGFGKFIGFQNAYTYWIALWVGNAAIAITAIGYLQVFWPFLKNPFYASIGATLLVWLFTLVNAKGIKTAGIVQLVTTLLKFIPILLIIVLGWSYFHPEYITNNFNITNKSNFSAFSYASTLTLWAFVGLESATVPADSVKNPKRNIPLATLIGTGLAGLLYILSSTLVLGLIPNNELVNLNSPFAEAARVICGTWGARIASIGALIACLGTLNGWILLQGQTAVAAAEEGLFPKILAKRSKNGTPIAGLIVTTILMSILLMVTSEPNLINQFQLIILIAATFSLTPYFYTAIAQLVLNVKRKDNHAFGNHKISTIIAILAGLYAFWALFGSGKDILFYVTLTMFSSIPLYVLVVKKNVYLQKEAKEL